MKYYIKNSFGFLTEISKEKFYSLRRRKSVREIVSYNNDVRVARILKL